MSSLQGIYILTQKSSSPVFYDPSIPQYLSYGAFGSVSGHELSHGKPVLEYVDAPWLIRLAFDSMGRHYDETGNFTDWWDDSTVEAFEDKAQCFIDQYHKFTVPNPNGEPLHVNGRLTVRHFNGSSFPLWDYFCVARYVARPNCPVQHPVCSSDMSCFSYFGVITPLLSHFLGRKPSSCIKRLLLLLRLFSLTQVACLEQQC